MYEEKQVKKCDRTSHPEKCPHARTSHALLGIAFRTHFRTHIARAEVRFYAHVRRNPTSDYRVLNFKAGIMLFKQFLIAELIIEIGLTMSLAPSEKPELSYVSRNWHKTQVFIFYDKEHSLDQVADSHWSKLTLIPLLIWRTFNHSRRWEMIKEL